MPPLFLAEEPPEFWWYPLVWPILFSGIGLWIYARAVASQRYEAAPKWKILWLVTSGVGLIFGLDQIRKFTDIVYLQVVKASGGKMMAGHIGAIAIPLLTILGILGYEKFAGPGRDKT